MTHSSPVRVLIATSDTGGGHRALSNALAGALERHYGSRVMIEIPDVFMISPTLFERVTRLYGYCIRLAPWLYGRLYHLLNDPRLYRRMGDLQGPMVAKMVDMIEARQPDVIVNTHPLANRSLLDATERLRRRVPILATVSELVSVHTSWVDPRLAILNTATDESYQAVLRWGAPRDRVRCFGLPVDERFSEVTEEPEAIRVSLGLDPEMVTALLIGGGEGAGGIEAIVQAIQSTDLPVQLIVVCGRNEGLRARLEHTRLRTPAHICGFVKTIPELMRASDVVITKGGPQTISEALVAQRPVILTQTLPGQEEGNGWFVENRGVGFAPGPVDQIVANLGRLVRNPAERAQMTANAARHGRPAAAREVAGLVVDLAEARVR